MKVLFLGILFFSSIGVLANSPAVDENGLEVCEDSKNVPADQLVIAYVKKQTLYPLAALHVKKLIPLGSINVKNHGTFYEPDQKKGFTVVPAPSHRDDHTDKCVYTSMVSRKGTKDIYIVSSKKGSFKFPIPKLAEVKFKELRGRCTNQGDHEPEKCVFKELLAVSDLNGNGRDEYWYTRPYLWDTGVTVAELSEDSKELRVLKEDCSDCSD